MMIHRRTATALMAFLALAVTAGTAQSGQQFSVVATFAGGVNGQDSLGGVVIGSNGNIYGTTSYSSNQNGTVFEVTPGSTTPTTLAAFSGNSGATPGSSPQDGLIMDSAGNLYGTTQYGGAKGDGTVFEVTNTGTFKSLYSFGATSGDGTYPIAGLTIDAQGNLYGVTSAGGANNDGTVFKLTTGATPTMTTIVSFAGANGASPYGGLAMDSQGNLYGTTEAGGDANGDGTVFKVNTVGSPTITTLATFSGNSGGTLGSNPFGNVILGANGNLYGTTLFGGTNGDGTVFQVTTTGTPTFTSLASFNGTDGSAPVGGLVMDAAGNLFGTTTQGGKGNGTIYELNTSGAPAITTLINFTGNGGADPGSQPNDSLYLDANGNLFGTTAAGGTNTKSSKNFGEVFELSGVAVAAAPVATPEPATVNLLASAGLFLAVSLYRAGRRDRAFA